MLIRGQTTEDRIRDIANSFAQGIDKYSQGQRRFNEAQQEDQRYQQAQEAKALQEEANKRQKAFEIEAKMSEQTGRNVVGSGLGQKILKGEIDPSFNIGDFPLTRKAESDAIERERKIKQDELDAEYKRSQINKNNNNIKAPPLSYEEKIRTKQRLDQENEVNKKPTTDQRKVATFYSRVDQAEKDFRKLSEAGYNRASFEESAKAMLPNAVKSENLKKQDQAERNFVNAVLRRESGAAIADSEFKSAELQYFPRVGDTPEVIEQKRKNREIVMAGLRAEAGDRAVNEIQTQIGNQSAPSLKPGLVEDGYQYLGGDPADSSSWKKV